MTDHTTRRPVARLPMRFLLAPLFALCGIAHAAGPLYIPASIPFAEGADIDPTMIADCPLQQDFAQTLARSLKSFDPQPVPGKLDTRRKGRVLSVEIVDLSNSGNGFIGYQTYIRLKGTLYQDGKKVASFFDKANMPGDLTTVCRQLRVSLRAEAYYIRKWMENPVDGAKLKHIGE